MRMKQDDNILSRDGNKRPFNVPKGYFENLTASIMSNIPEPEVNRQSSRLPIVTPWSRVKPYIYAAAIFVGVLFLCRVTTSTLISNRSISQSDDIYYSDEYIESFFETAMVDDYTLLYSFIDFN